MAAPRKKKKAPPFDVTGIDFSVITTALETGGKMIEQIMNGIQYGSPEVRLLMLEECDFILECRVCRGLFRALPNFIAHKRVYCCQAYSDYTHDVHFQSATTVVPPQEQVVVVEPEAPEDVPPKGLRQPRQSKDKGKEQKKDKVGTDTSSLTTTSKKTSKLQVDSNGKQCGTGNHPLDAANEKSGTKTRSQQAEKSTDKAADSLAETIRQIEGGQLGKSQEYAYYTAAAEKMEKEKNAAEHSESFHLTSIPSIPCAVFVNKGSLPCDQGVVQPASSRQSIVPGAAEMEEKQPMKNSPKEGSTPVINQEHSGNKTASSTETAAASSAGLAPTRKAGISKATIRCVTKVVKELRQKKEQHNTKEKACLEDKAQKSTYKNTKPILLPIPSTTKPPPTFPTNDRSAITGDIKSVTEKIRLTSPSPTPSTKSTDQFSDIEQNKEGCLRAVVKRCLTGRPGSLRVSPLKSGEWNTDADNISEAGSYGERGETPSPLLRQDSNGDQGVMDMENLHCKICNKNFAGRKSLMYHCQSRHSGQRTIFPCPYCPRVFYYFWGLTRHLNTNHKKTRSDIDRMRKGLRRKAYKQNIIEEHITGKQLIAESTNSKGKNETVQKVRPSVHAKKMVAVSKSVPPSTSVGTKNPPSSLYMPNRRRRVEVITSVKSRSGKTANVYKKVYASKRTESPLDSPVTANPLSPPFRTRKLVAKALRTTRSKRVYNRTAIDSPPVSPEKETKKMTVTKTAKAHLSSKVDQNPGAASSSKSSISSEKVFRKDEQNIAKMGISAALHKVSKSDCQKSAPYHEENEGHVTALLGSPNPDTGSSADAESTKDKLQVNVRKMNELVTEVMSQPQTRARMSSEVLDVASTTGHISSYTDTKLSKGVVAKETSLQVMVQGKREIKVFTSSPSLESSSLLHICPHCHRAFGRKISLDSHIKICNRAKSVPSSLKQPPQAFLLTHRSQGRGIEDVRTRASVSRDGSKPQTVQAKACRRGTRILRENSIEKTEIKPRLQHKPTAKLQDTKSSSKNSSSKESLVDCQMTSKEVTTDSMVMETLSRSRKKTDSKAGCSRDSSVDSLRTRRSDSKQTHLPAERTPQPLYLRESESSQDSSVDSKNRASYIEKVSPEENLLIISRQRLSEQLLAATTSREKDPSSIRPRTENQRGILCGDTHSDSQKTESAQITVSRNSLEKPTSQRTVTPSVLRKSLKGKLIESPQKPSQSRELHSGTSANFVSPLKQSAGNPKILVKETTAVNIAEDIKMRDFSSVQSSESPQKQKTSTVTVLGKEHLPSPQTVFSSGSSPQGNLSEMSRRPRRKRRTPARVMDSEITLPKGSASKKKARLDPNQDGNATKDDTTLNKTSLKEKGSSLECSPSTSSKTRVEKQDKKDTDKLMTLEEIWVEKKAGRPAERVRSRIYVVEPSHAGRLTCQDTRKVEEIVDETGLTCLHCDQRFTSVSNLRRHAIRHLGWKRFKCRLCRFCSYNRSECNTHIMRTHFERVRLGSSGARIDSFITDLNRQAASVRSLKKQQTLNSHRQGCDAMEERRLFTHIRLGRRKAKAVANPKEETAVIEALGSSSNPEPSIPSTASRRSASRGKIIVSLTNESSKNKPSRTTSFNISTRNSPRKFDTRPYTRDDNSSTLNTRKGTYAKRNLSDFSQNLTQTSVEESKKIDTISENTLTDQRAIKEASAVDTNSSPLPSNAQAELHQNIEEGKNGSAARRASASMESTRQSEDMVVDQDMEQSLHGGGKNGDKTKGETSVVSRGLERSMESNQKVEEEKSEFVVRKHDDSDLMNVEELQTLPEHFMSDDDDELP